VRLSGEERLSQACEDFPMVLFFFSFIHIPGHMEIPEKDDDGQKKKQAM
jgi:hypothetical protein